jgi:hypothetical protein
LRETAYTCDRILPADCHLLYTLRFIHMKNALFLALATAVFTWTPSALAQGQDDSLLPIGVTQHLARGFTWAAAGGGAESPGWDWTRPDAMAPAGVSHSRPVAEGQWRLSYTLEIQEFGGLRDGRDDLANGALFSSGFSTLPSEATFQTRSLNVQHGLGDGWSVFGTLPLIDREMVNLTGMGASSFTSRSSGIGDVSLGAAYELIVCNGRLLRLNLGMSLPTGSVDERDTDENGASFLLPYAMQRGTGTHDLLPGVTMIFQEPSWSWGVQAQARVHMGTNSEGWSWGPSMETSAWASRGWTESVSTSLRLMGDFSSDLHGDADDASPFRNPLEATGAQGGDRLDIAGGVQWLLDDRPGVSNLLSLELALPVDEWVKGPQLSTDWRLVLGWQWSF